MVNGQLTTAVDGNMPADAFAVGTRLILFLTYIPDRQRLFLTSGPYSAFKIEGGTVRPLKVNPDERRNLDGMSTGQFIAEVERLVTRRRMVN
jgi:hypothetical protein